MFLLTFAAGLKACYVYNYITFFQTQYVISLSRVRVSVPLLSACHGPCMAVHPWESR